jgi:hypothetical protein
MGVCAMGLREKDAERYANGIILSDNHCLSLPVGLFDLQHHPLYKHVPAAVYRRICNVFNVILSGYMNSNGTMSVFVMRNLNMDPHSSR